MWKSVEKPYFMRFSRLCKLWKTYGKPMEKTMENFYKPMEKPIEK